jgi:DNA-binding phage protein
MAKRIIHKLTPEQKIEFEKKVAAAEADKPYIMARGRELLAEHDQMRGELADVFRALRAERERLGLSLADVAAKTGIPRESICRLENLERGNFTIDTVQRYAKALGLKIQVSLVAAKS